MDTIALVPSFNGAGHLRRILKIAEELVKRRFKVLLTIGGLQIKLPGLPLRQLLATGLVSTWLAPGPLGLEGPQWGRADQQLNVEVPQNIQKIFSRSRLVISDNSLWPARFSSTVSLMAQFLWLDYWRESGIQCRPELHRSESQLAEQIGTRYSSPVFGIASSYFPTSSTVPLSLFEYSYDYAVRKKPINREVWVVSGTTGLGGLAPEQPIYLKSGFTVKKMETYHLETSGYRPSLVVGRPGLGSIRDSLSAGVPFLPLLEGSDFELSQNADSLRGAGLVLDNWQGISLSDLDDYDLDSDLPPLRTSVADFVSTEFSSVEDLVDILMSQAGGSDS